MGLRVNARLEHLLLALLVLLLVVYWRGNFSAVDAHIFPHLLFSRFTVVACRVRRASMTSCGTVATANRIQRQQVSK